MALCNHGSVSLLLWNLRTNAESSSALYIELDLPPTGITSLEDRVGVSGFNAPFCEADHRGNQSSHFQNHYAALVALRRLCANVHRSISDCRFFNNFLM